MLNALRFAARATQIKVQAKIVRYHFILKHFSLHPINTPLTLQMKFFDCPSIVLLSPVLVMSILSALFIFFVLSALFILSSLFIESVLLVLSVLSALSILIHTYPPCYLLCVLHAFDYFSLFFVLFLSCWTFEIMPLFAFVVCVIINWLQFLSSSCFRFIDYEGLYNKAQKALASIDDKESEKDKILARTKELSEMQEGELGRLR